MQHLTARVLIMPLLPLLLLQMAVAASMLLQDTAQDRDVFWGWIRAWRGQRALPPP